MDSELSELIMAKRLVVEAPALSLFFVVNLISFLGVAIFLFKKIRDNRAILIRLPFSFTAAMCLAYQLPLVIFSQQVLGALENAWGYAVVVNGISISLLLWLSATRSYDIVGTTFPAPRKSSGIYLVVGVVAGTSLWLYLSAVPWDCTALYALLFDPPYTLFARELGVKLLGTSVATYSLGAYAVSIVPIFLILSAVQIGKSISQRRPLVAVSLFIFGFAAVIAVLVTGIKGLLMPSALMTGVAILYYKRTWTSRMVSMVLAVLFFFAAVSVFEFIKERGVYESNGQYDFASCSVKMGACKGSQSLMDSIKGQRNALGLSIANADQMRTRLNCLCDGVESPVCNEPALTKLSLLNQTSGGVSVSESSQTNFDTESIGTRSDPSINSIAGISPVILIGLPGRLVTYADALLYRLIVVPFQVSIWHFMYAETEAVVGLETLPFARRLLGQSLNMPELVYQKYGSIYWGGDKTNTSSAPTSFVMAYPAYLGLAGVILALGCIISLDAAMIFLSSVSTPGSVPILGGAGCDHEFQFLNG